MTGSSPLYHVYVGVGVALSAEHSKNAMLPSGMVRSCGVRVKLPRAWGADESVSVSALCVRSVNDTLQICGCAYCMHA